MTTPTERYYMYCDACDCYEYDCHGITGCIKNVDGFVGAHERYKRGEQS